MQVLHEPGGQLVVAFEVGARPLSGRIHRVVAAEEDPVVLGEPVVVELVARVADALPVLPPDRRAHVGGERSGHHHVIEHRDDEGVEPLSNGAWAAVVSATRRASTRPPNVRTDMPAPEGSRASTPLCSWMRTPSSSATRASPQTQSRRVDDAHVRVVDRAGVEGGVHLVAGAFAVPERHVHAVPGRRSHVLVGVRHLVGLRHDLELPGPPVAAVDAVRLDGLFDAAQVLDPHPVQQRELVGPALDAVEVSVRDGSGHEAAVASRGAAGDPPTLEQDHVEVGSSLFRAHRGPQPGQARPDHDQVGGGVAVQGWPRCRAEPLAPASTARAGRR